jgi:ankyrin repeat protein
LKECLGNGGTLHCEDEHGNTALHMACANGATDIVVYIMEMLRNDPQQSQLLNARNKNGSTALHWAALNGHKSIVELLINGHCNVNVEDHQGKSPYYYAERNNHESVLEILLAAMEQQQEEEEMLHEEELEGQDDLIQEIPYGIYASSELEDHQTQENPQH